MKNLLSKLNPLKEQNILADIDIQLYQFFKELAGNQEEVLLSAVLLSYLYRQGDVCLKLDEVASSTLFPEADAPSNFIAPDLDTWLQALQKSELVGTPGSFKPLILDEHQRLYLHKLWHFENGLAEKIIKKCSSKNKVIDTELLSESIDNLFPDSENHEVNWQKVASIAALYNHFTVISGGPGTGKTSTVVRILALIVEQVLERGEKISIALAAPTGKAAARLKESILSTKEELSVSEKIKEAIPSKAKTIHQLLGARRHSARFTYHADNPLPYDVVIIDEASMVDQPLMSKFMEALLEKTSVILLGDKDQLSSVEAGAVLGNICGIQKNGLSPEFSEILSGYNIQVSGENRQSSPAPLTDNIILLEKNYRFSDESGIARLAAHINAREEQEALAVLEDEVAPDVSIRPIADLKSLELELVQIISRYLLNITGVNDAGQLFTAFQHMQVLCAHRRGPYGVEYLNARIEQLMKREGTVPADRQWYHGRPVIINQNSYGLGLFNGDIGICTIDDTGNRQVIFQREKTVQRYAPARLPDFSLAYALTIHKSQGSEFDNVMLVLPDQSSRLLTKELLYTAVTRAKKGVEILGGEEILSEGIKQNISRSSGLRDRLWSTSS